MSDETFAVSLAGRRWDVPHLPFRLVKKIQPALFQLYAELGGADISPGAMVRLDETQLDRLARAAFGAVSHLDAGLTEAEFFSLSFSVVELIHAFPSIARAVGLRATDSADVQAAQEAPPESGKSSSTV